MLGFKTAKGVFALLGLLANPDGAAKLLRQIRKESNQLGIAAVELEEKASQYKAELDTQERNLDQREMILDKRLTELEAVSRV